MLSPTYEITTALSHTDELISPPYDIAIVTISYGRVTMSSVWDSMMSKKNMGWPFYAAVHGTSNTHKFPFGFEISWKTFSGIWEIHVWHMIASIWLQLWKLDGKLRKAKPFSPRWHHITDVTAWLWILSYIFILGEESGSGRQFLRPISWETMRIW